MFVVSILGCTYAKRDITLGLIHGVIVPFPICIIGGMAVGGIGLIIAILGWLIPPVDDGVKYLTNILPTTVKWILFWTPSAAVFILYCYIERTTRKSMPAAYTPNTPQGSPFNRTIRRQ